MAKLNRTVWELRFKALKQEIMAKIEGERWSVASKALSTNLTELEKAVAIRNLEMLNGIKQRADDIEYRTATKLFLSE